MDYLLIGERILAAIQALFGLKGSLETAKREQRERMVALFEKVAECLDSAASELRRGNYPGGRCQELLTYAVELPAVVKGVLEEGKAKEIGDALRDAHEVERLFAVRGTPEGEADIGRLDEAAGLLRALGNLLRAR